ncbi:MAG: hypothetical protein ACYC6L_16410 [Anaerolineae bacterium]
MDSHPATNRPEPACQALDQQLALFSARHALSAARLDAIHRQVLNRMAPLVSPLPRVWLENLAASLRTVGQTPVHLGLSLALVGTQPDLPRNA